MQNCGVIRVGLQAGLPAGLKQNGGPLVGRFVSKLMVDVLPAALASLIGGFLYTQYQYARPPQPTTVQVTPASAEMMQLLRDEHTAIVDYLRVQVATEKNRLAAEDQEDARAVADAKTAATDAKAAADAKIAAVAAAEAKAAADAKALAAAATRRLAVAALAVKPAHAKPPVAPATAVVATTHAPLVIASADTPATAPPADTVARDPNSLVAKTLDLKDHVVAATKSVVSAIGDIPSWIADRITPSQPAPAPRQFSTNS